MAKVPWPNIDRLSFLLASVSWHFFFFVNIMKYLKIEPFFRFPIFFHLLFSLSCKWLPLFKFACSAIQLLWQTYCIDGFTVFLLTFAVFFFLFIVWQDLSNVHVSSS